MNTYWKQKNGKLISVDDMDINHLRNVLKMLIKNNEKALLKAKHSTWLKAKPQFKLRGDMANQFHECYPSDEDDLGYQFHDDECRGQW